MILTLQNVLYYLYSNGFIEENRVFQNTIEARQADSLNSTFLIRFKDDKGRILNDGRVVKQAFKIAEEQRIALRKDAYFTCVFESSLILNHSKNCLDTLRTSIDDEKLIFIRKYLNGKNFYSVLKSIHEKSTSKTQNRLDINNTSNAIFSKINTVHNYAISNIAITGLCIDFPISIPNPKVSSSYLQQFWQIIGDEFKEFIKQESKKWGIHDDYKKLIHGDFSLRNIVYTEKQFYFVDWEFAQFGNPIWDYAWFISDVESSFPKEEFKELIISLKEKIYSAITDKVILEKYILIAKLRRALRSVTEGVFSDEKAKIVSSLNAEFEKL